MTHRRTSWSILLVTVTMLAAFVQPASGSEIPDFEAVELTLAETQAQGDGALVADATEYAKAFGVTEAEALNRLKMQAVVSDLSVALFGSRDLAQGLVGVSIRHAPTYGVEVYTTDLNATASIEKVAASLGIEVVEVIKAPLGLDELARAQEAVASLVPSAATYTDFRFGELVVVSEQEFRTPGSQDLVALPPAIRAALEVDGLNFRWEQGTVEATVNLYGGLDIGSCSSGFAVKKGSTYGVTTAGHCGSSMSWAGKSLPFFAEKWVHQSKHDIQWHSKDSSHTIKNWATDGLNDSTPYYRTITSVQNSAGYVTNQWVCKWGQTTKYDCGTVTSVTFTSTYDGKTIINQGLVERSGHDLAEPGDSGGPVYASNKAVGSMSAKWGDKMIFYPAHRFAWSTGIGVTILTSS